MRSLFGGHQTATVAVSCHAINHSADSDELTLSPASDYLLQQEVPVPSQGCREVLVQTYRGADSLVQYVALATAIRDARKGTLTSVDQRNSREAQQSGCGVIHSTERSLNQGVGGSGQRIGWRPALRSRTGRSRTGLESRSPADACKRLHAGNEVDAGKQARTQARGYESRLPFT